MIMDLDETSRSPERGLGDDIIYHTKFKCWGSNMQAISAMKKEFLSANGDGKIFTVWLKLDFIVTNLQFTDQIRLLS